MKQRRRIYYSAAQRAEIWDRWQAGESMSSIGRRFDRESSSVFSVISPTGGIRPPLRRRASQPLSLGEREEISRGLSAHCSLRRIARQLGRAPSTISREILRNGGPDGYRATRSDQAGPAQAQIVQALGLAGADRVFAEDRRRRMGAGLGLAEHQGRNRARPLQPGLGIV